MNSQSLTKGCFVHRPTNSKKKKSGIQEYFSQGEKYGHLLWEDMETRIKDIVKRSYEETFKDLEQFVISCHLSEILDEVPTAVLMMGVNMTDHASIFQLLERHLNGCGFTGTVILDPKKCTSLSNILHLILTELSSKFEKFLGDQYEVPKKADCSISMLLLLHSSIAEKVSKQRKFPSSLNRIVLLIQDIENFNTELLQELILICKMQAGVLPIVLVLGMASAMLSLHQLLPHKALCCLGVEVLHPAPASHYLNKIIEEVVMCPSLPFKLGPKLFRLIVDSTLYHDFSVTNLSYLLKYSILEHLYSNQFPTLCCPRNKIEENINRLNEEELQAFRALSSFKLYLDNNPEIASNLKSSSTLKRTVISLVSELHQNQELILLLLKLLCCFVSDLPGCPLGKKLRELYSMSLEEEIHETAAFSQAQKLLKMQSQQSLTHKLRECLEILKTSSHHSQFVEETKANFELAINRLSQLSAEDHMKNVPDPTCFHSESITSRHQLQEKIQASIQSKRSNFETLRNETVESLLKIFKCIRPPSQFPFHEIFYFDDATSVKRHLMAVPRVTLCRALTNPQHYLKCSCCRISHNEETQPSMPDISLIYKLHLECGKLINLCDWLEVFKSIKRTTFNVNIKSSATQEQDEELNIRFMQAVKELQLLGFIKPTKRKTDHVNRLTFGMC